MIVETDTAEAVEIAPRIWWVGSLIPDDKFQCHVYLVEQGDQSVLIDPGSALIADEVIRKVNSVIGLANVRWFVCSHADPDIIGALPALIARGLHPEAAIVTHWRDAALIVHSGTSLPFWRIEEHQWQLALEDRTLRFVFSPYLHFAGAFCTFDEVTGTLFSSDLFGGFTEDRSLFASSMAYFDSIRAFHEHYMPSREILVHTLQQLNELPLQRIAPQHGQVIPAFLIAPIIEKLEALECGYLLARDDPDLAFLLAANQTIHDVVDTLVREQQFSVVASHLADLATRTLGAEYLELWADADGVMLQFEKSDDYIGHPAVPPKDVEDVLTGGASPTGSRLIWPLTSLSSNQIDGAAILGFRTSRVLDRPTLGVIKQITGLVKVGFERELLRHVADSERAQWHERAIRDSLTGLYNRVSLSDSFRRLLAFDDRSDVSQMAALMIDIDHFKDVNDNFGHSTGDLVLQRVAQTIVSNVRPGDFAFRFGGEEFLVLLSNVSESTARSAAERIRRSVADAIVDPPSVCVSIGVALRQGGEEQEPLIARADAALYRAKADGRNRVELSTIPD